MGWDLVNPWVIVSALCCVLLSAPLLHAADERPPSAQEGTEGTVLAIDAGDLVLDVGSGAEVQVGTVVELWRPMRVRHPVTGKVLTDRFKLGTVRLTEVRSVLSLAKVDASAFRRPPMRGGYQARSFDQGGPMLGGGLSYAF